MGLVVVLGDRIVDGSVVELLFVLALASVALVGGVYLVSLDMFVMVVLAEVAVLVVEVVLSGVEVVLSGVEIILGQTDEGRLA